MLTIAILITVQFVFTFIVIFVLKKLWDKELIRAAIEKFSACPSSTDVKKIMVCSASGLSEEFKSHIEAICQRKFAQASVSITQDATLKGGVVITVGDQSFDYSLSR